MHEHVNNGEYLSIHAHKYLPSPHQNLIMVKNN